MTARRALLLVLLALLVAALGIAAWADCHGHACTEAGPCDDGCALTCAYGCTHAVLSPPIRPARSVDRTPARPASRIGVPAARPSPVFEPPRRSR